MSWRTQIFFDVSCSLLELGAAALLWAIELFADEVPVMREFEWIMGRYVVV